MTEDDVLAAADALIAAFAATDTAAYFDWFSPDATFVFHPEPARMDSRAAYEALWAGWLAAGWRVVSCTSTEQLVQLYGDVAVFTHSLRTITSENGVESTIDERETIVFTRVGERLIAVHEHLSPMADGD